MDDIEARALRFSDQIPGIHATIRKIEQGLGGLEDHLWHLVNVYRRPYASESCNAVNSALVPNDYNVLYVNPDEHDGRPFDPKVVLLGGVHPKSYAANAAIIAALIEDGFLTAGGSLLMEGSRGVADYAATDEINLLADNLLKRAPAGGDEAWKAGLDGDAIARCKALSLSPFAMKRSIETRRKGGMMLQVGEACLVLEESHYVPKIYDLLKSKGVHLAAADSPEDFVPTDGDQGVSAVDFWLSLIRRSAKGFIPGILDRLKFGNVVVVFGLYDLLCKTVMHELVFRDIHFVGAVPKKIDKMLRDPPGGGGGS